MTKNPNQRVLAVMTSHGVKGSTGQPTGYYLSELTHPLSVLEAAGIAVDFASVKGGEPPVDGLDLNDPENTRYWNDATFRAAIANTPTLADVDLAGYDAIFFPGGHGTVWDLPESQAVAAAIRDVYEDGGIVAAVCHGPAALVNATLSDGSYLVAGKTVAAFTDEEERAVGLEKVVPFLLSSTLEKRGAKLQHSANWSANVAVDGRLITGQNPQSAGKLGEALRDALLCTKAKAA